MSIVSSSTPLRLVVAFVGHFAAGWLGYEFTTAHHFVALGWPALGVGAVTLVCFGFKVLPALMASSLLLHAYWNEGLNSPSAFFILADMVEIVVAARILTWRCSWHSGFSNVRQLQRVVTAGIVASIASAPIYAMGLGNVIGQEDSFLRFISVGSMFWVRSATGFGAIAPVLLSWIPRPKAKLGKNVAESSAVAMAVGLLCVCVFTDWVIPGRHQFWLALVPVVGLFWSAARCGLFLTSHLVLLVLAVASWVATSNTDLFGDIGGGGARSSSWAFLDLFGFCAVSLSLLSDYVVIKHGNEKVAHQKLEQLVFHSPIALIELDVNLAIQVWSEQAIQVFGYSPEQALGQTAPDFLIPESERAGAWARWHHFAQKKSGSQHFTLHAVTADGEQILCDCYGSLLRSTGDEVIGVVCLIVNVSEREAASLALQESERRLRNISEVLPQMICFYDRNLVRRFANKAYQAAFRGIEDLGPAPLEDLIEPSAAAEFSRNSMRALGGEQVRFVERLQLNDGEVHSIDRILLPNVGADGQVNGFFSVATDISELLADQNERLALETQILQTQKLESLGKLAGRLAHEFNNRLFGIIGHADIACQDVPPENPGYQAINKVLDIGREASDLCRQMFVFSGHGTGVKAEVDCGAMVMEMRRLMEISLPKNMRLTTSISPDLPAVAADEPQVRQALMNLVNNAADASGGSRAEVQIHVFAAKADEVELTESFLTGSASGNQLVGISVRDDCGGISPDDMPRIFDPFYTTRSGSKGLGLAGVIGIIHSHCGALLAESEESVGTSITMFFPGIAAGMVESDSEPEEASA